MSTFPDICATYLKRYHELVSMFQEKGYNDDRMIMVNYYNRLHDLSIEEPKTTSGQLAINANAMELLRKMMELHHSFKSRGMLQ